LYIKYWAIDRAIFFCGYAIHFFHSSVHSYCISLNFKLKLRAFPNFRFDANFTLQLLNDEFRDSEAKAHTSLVYFFGLVKFPKKLKQSLDSFWLYSNACISHSGNEASILILKRHCDASFECKLGCIANEVK
jgi:hypothetical protein